METMQSESMTTVSITRYEGQELLDSLDVLAVEEPLEIAVHCNVDGKPVEKNISVTMRTPGNDDELALGFLFTEGIIRDCSQLHDILLPADNRVVVVMRKNESPVLHGVERNFYTTSSCGVCGKSSVDAIRSVSAFPPTQDKIAIDSTLLFGLQEKLNHQQPVFERTGGLHASALFDLQSNLVLLREDVGRHNALDKVIGASLKSGTLPLSKSILLLSGRASFELIQKASMAGIKIVAAIGAPSSLAVQLAEESDITLVAFLRRTRFNVYSGSKRINTKTQRTQG
jgi:FdhD protein